MIFDLYLRNIENDFHLKNVDYFLYHLLYIYL